MPVIGPEKDSDETKVRRTRNRSSASGKVRHDRPRTGYSGKNALLEYHAGRRITLGRAVKAKCFDCMGRYQDGRADCRIPACPLYPWMPYRAQGDKA